MNIIVRNLLQTWIGFRLKVAYWFSFCTKRDVRKFRRQYKVMHYLFRKEIARLNSFEPQFQSAFYPDDWIAEKIKGAPCLKKKNK